MSQLQVTGEAKIRDIQGPVVANAGVITALDGAASQYVRGDGTLADFPSSSGGGSSVSYYLNSSVSQGTIDGNAYRELSKEPIIGTGTDIAISSNGYVANYITDANDPDVILLPGGNFNCEFYFSVNNNTGSPTTYAELYKYDGSTFTLLGSSSGVPESINQGTTIAPYYFAIPVATATLATTDRLAIRIYVNVDGRTVTLHTENSHLCQVVTTLSKGMVSLNNLTDQSQYLTTGTSGTNFNIVSSGDTHTFNLPVASATNTGKLSSTDWTTFNNKQNAITDPITGTGASGQIAYFNSGTSITSEAAFNYDASTNRLGVNTSVPNATIGANAGTDSGYSLLLKNDNTNYNGIGFGVSSVYGNIIETLKLGSALSRNLTLFNQSGYLSLTEDGNLGLGILTPSTGLDIYNGTSAYLWLHTATSGLGASNGVRLALFNTNGANLRNFEGSFSITAEGDFSVITLGAENFRINSADGSIYQSKVSDAMLKTVSGVITAAVAGTDYVSPSSLSGYVPTSRTLTINGTAYDLSANRSWSVGTISGGGSSGRVAYYDGASSITSEAGFTYDSSTNRLGVNTTVPNATIGANAGTDSGYSLLLKNADTNYNGIGFGTDSTYGNLISTEKLGTATAKNITILNQSGFVSLTEGGNLGLNVLTPAVAGAGIDIYSSTSAGLRFHTATSGTTVSDGAGINFSSANNLGITNYEAGAIDIVTNGNSGVYINSSGYVGISGATPSTALTVNGAITQSSVTSSLLKTNSSGTIIAAVAGTDYVAPSALSGYLPLTGGNITGNLTIGSPASALAQFHIYNASAAATMLVQTNSSSDYAEIAARNYNSVSTAYYRQYSSSASGTDFGASRSNLAALFSNYASNFAIGTQNGGALILGTANTARLTIASTGEATFTSSVTAKSAAIIETAANTYGSLSITGNARGGSVDFYSGATSVGGIYADASANLYLYSGNSFTNRLTIASNGDATFTGTAPILAIKSNTTGNVFLRLMQGVDTVSSFYYNNATSTLTISNNNAGIQFNTSGVTNAFNLASTGAATFSSVVGTSSNFISNKFSDSITIGVDTAGNANYNYVGYSGYWGLRTSQTGTNFCIDTYNGGTPKNVLSITQSGAATFSSSVTANQLLLRNNSDLEFINIGQSTGNQKQLLIGSTYASNVFYIQGIQQNVGYNQNIALNSQGGNVLIGTTTDNGYKFTVAGQSIFTNTVSSVVTQRTGSDGQILTFYKDGTLVGSISTNTYSLPSDLNFKKNISNLELGLNLISKLRAVSYNHKIDDDGAALSTGFIAQELEESLTELGVKQNKYYFLQNTPNEDKSQSQYWLDYTKIIPILVNAIQEQQAQIEELKQLINNK